MAGVVHSETHVVLGGVFGKAVGDDGIAILVERLVAQDGLPVNLVDDPTPCCDDITGKDNLAEASPQSLQTGWVASEMVVDDGFTSECHGAKSVSDDPRMSRSFCRVVVHVNRVRVPAGMSITNGLVCGDGLALFETIVSLFGTS